MASTYLRGKTWWVRYRDHTGEIVQRSLKTNDKKEAKIKKLDIEHKLTHDKPIQGNAPWFGAYSIDYMAWRTVKFPRSQFRIDNLMKNHLLPEFEWVPLDKMTPERVDQYDAKRIKAEASVATRLKELKTIKSLLNKAVRDKKLTASPLEKYTLPTLPNKTKISYFTRDELELIYSKSNPTHRAMWQFLANTGLRRGEAFALLLENVQENSILVTGTKTDDERSVPLNATAKAARDVLKSSGDGIHLFPRIRIENIGHMFEHCCKRVGVEGNLHMLRHSFATHLILKGVPITVVRDLLGHKSVVTTQKYLSAVPKDEMTSAVSKLDAAIPAAPNAPQSAISP